MSPLRTAPSSRKERETRYSQTPLYSHLLIQISHYYGQFPLSLLPPEGSPYIFSFSLYQQILIGSLQPC